MTLNEKYHSYIIYMLKNKGHSTIQKNSKEHIYACI